MLIRLSSVHFKGDKKRKKIKMSPDVPSHRAASKEAKQWTSLVSAGGMAVWTAKGVDGRRGPHKPRGMRIPGTSQIRVNYL